MHEVCGTSVVRHLEPMFSSSLLIHFNRECVRNERVLVGTMVLIDTLSYAVRLSTSSSYKKHLRVVYQQKPPWMDGEQRMREDVFVLNQYVVI